MSVGDQVQPPRLQLGEQSMTAAAAIAVGQRWLDEWAALGLAGPIDVEFSDVDGRRRLVDTAGFHKGGAIRPPWAAFSDERPPVFRANVGREWQDGASENTTQEVSMSAKREDLERAAQRIDSATPIVESDHRTPGELEVMQADRKLQLAVRAIRRIVALLQTSNQFAAAFDGNTPSKAMILTAVKAPDLCGMRVGDTVATYEETEAIKWLLGAATFNPQDVMTQRGDLAHLRQALVAAKPAIERLLARLGGQEIGDVGLIEALTDQAKVLPAHVTGEDGERHEHDWKQATGHVAVHAVPEQSIMVEFCECGAFQIQRGDDKAKVYIPESEAGLLGAIEVEVAKHAAAIETIQLRQDLESERRKNGVFRKERDEARVEATSASAAAQNAEQALARTRSHAAEVELQAACLVSHLDGSDGMPPAWWLEAAAAANAIRELTSQGGHDAEEPRA